MGFTKIGGVFVVLVLGCLIAFMFSILEFLWNIRKVAIEEEVGWDFDFDKNKIK